MAGLARAILEIETDRRVAPRAEFGRPGTLRTGNDVSLEITVSDLTRDGCRIHTDETLFPDMPVHVGLAHVGLTAGRIVWRSTTGYGCRFDQPLAVGVVTAAFGPTNIASLPTATPVPATRIGKIAPRQALAIIAAVAMLGWGMVGAGLLLLLR